MVDIIVEKEEKNIFTKGYNIPIILILIAVFFILLNLILTNVYGFFSLEITVPLFIFACIYGIIALSLNLEAGYAGLTNFGKIAFFMVGTYSAGIMYLFGYPFFIAIPVGIVVTAIFGYLLTIPTIKLREDYLAIVTIAVGEILRTALLIEKWFHFPQDNKAGGPLGLTVDNLFRAFFQSIEDNGFSILSFELVSSETFTNFYTGLNLDLNLFSNIIFMLVMVGILMLVYYLMEVISNSPWARVLRSMRENETVTESLGKDVVSYRIQAFVLASAIAGFAGGLFAGYFTTFDPNTFLPIRTFQLWIIVIIGGLGNNRGAIFGSFLFWSIEILTRTLKGEITSLLTTFSNFFNPINFIPGVPILQDFIIFDPISAQNIALGLLLILFLIFRPKGIIKEKPIDTVATRLKYKTVPEGDPD
ncbi:MAG: branched-chain amino acid ABC transporter permease [Candidatus Hodarchaeales archaeon]|jgi:ABC-type branched-subunit amino acid transport system permease subunit